MKYSSELCILEHNIGAGSIYDHCKIPFQYLPGRTEDICIMIVGFLAKI
jgi:hypothetical protein